MFRKEKQKQKEKSNLIDVGDRFFIRYDELSVPIAIESDEEVYDHKKRQNIRKLWPGRGFSTFSQLYTVIEVLPDGKYLDVITGEIFVRAVSGEKLLDTITPEYEDFALAQKEDILRHPIAISETAIIEALLGRRKLTDEIKQKIVAQIKDEKDFYYGKKTVSDFLEDLKKTSVSHIKAFYEELNKKIQKKRLAADMDDVFDGKKIPSIEERTKQEKAAKVFDRWFPTYIKQCKK